MADNAYDSDDILALWGPREDGALEPDRPRPHGDNGAARAALAAMAVSSDVGRACTHQLAGVLHEMLDASGKLSDRITAVQHDVSALHEAITELRRAVDSQLRTTGGRGRRTG